MIVRLPELSGKLDWSFLPDALLTIPAYALGDNHPRKRNGPIFLPHDEFAYCGVMDIDSDLVRLGDFLEFVDHYKDRGVEKWIHFDYWKLSAEKVQ